MKQFKEQKIKVIRMLTRRNWLLRCSILINVAVLLYLCSHLLIGGGNFALGPAYIISDESMIRPPQYRTHIPNHLAQQLRQEEREEALMIQQQQQQQQQQQTLSQQQPQSHSGVVIKIQENGISVQEVPQQQSVVGQQSQQQDQLLLDAAGAAGRDVDNSNNNINVEDSRFDVPTEPSSGSNNGPNGANKVAEVLYQDGGASNGAGAGLLNASDIFSTTSSIDLDMKLRSLLNCHDRDYEPYIGQRGDFWVLKNYIRAEHGELRCHETVTYTTHADYTFLDNLIPLLERWNAPVSLAMHAPGTDFVPTINSIKYLRDCLPESHLVRQLVTFHIYFSSKHIPKIVPKFDKVLEPPHNCSLPAPYFNVSSSQLYKTQKKLLYPVNVGRNIARDAAMSHFILASDIELYPNPGLVHKFLEMIVRNEPVLQRKNPRVFPLSIFEVDSSSPVPRDKTELQELLRNGKAIPFHKRVCSSCHGVPKSKEWIAANETDDLGVFHIGKRVGYFVHWEPIYIGTHADPHYDERLSWEGKSDKMTQGYALCVLDYDFHILDNAFLVHKPGIKVLKKDPKRAMLATKTNQLIKKIIYPELQVMYGTRKGCAV
ncbi:beta-1,4-glucuronyltransferase 1 [Toxorhynchites rutilus septentrionalis]|uniref:beta-1,4-glucuronyltransferase 1 n=1 Tax=Toxorhynchites rutilus septentrionalis TaxID=329112 RepID=UPI00247AC6F0|nr:beta-1,4-glucuronyltransferase 1 [Toxorhynchites rutilus septentrionalis]XP_055639778.1 beta-1,4-glucuronyltransferase 1 [Toxorhynchites rutilus septentrionalis]XP_055639779.1 beta-1,4-glucuronyltransferase 1 [Toxorhynchites rutilus septentrionalis]XP_055639780.1 beta-1,4-glucuronyltransferase 1 [Toxorhynchites rutilus septentrionalis]XP_055639781.1 beta-1,4-glucuronyltransferase 1 [Toxorhynchites rutilus septentrionalis]